MRICGYLAAICGLAILCSGCASTSGDREKHARLVSRTAHDRERAKEANERALKLVEEGELERAEVAFREAIGADPRFAAAHNNLGLVLLGKGKFYDAAKAFKTASRLRPNAVEPIRNLARLYEAAGWEKEAVRLRTQVEKRRCQSMEMIANESFEVNQGANTIDGGHETAEASLCGGRGAISRNGYESTIARP